MGFNSGFKGLRQKMYRKPKHFLCSVTFFFDNRGVYEIMWKNIIELGRPQMTIWRMRIACWIHKATNTHSEYVILIDVPLQKWLHERASLLRDTYTACLVFLWLWPAVVFCALTFSYAEDLDYRKHNRSLLYKLYIRRHASYCNIVHHQVINMSRYVK